MGTSTLEERIGDKLRTSQETLATAESCSGGLIAHRITNVAGASDYFLGGIVSYSNAAKITFLGVDRRSLERYGAVSEQVAQEMAEAAQERFGAVYAVSSTGIAGPAGGTKEKPVGLVYIGLAAPGGTTVERCTFSGDRQTVKMRTADKALSMLLESIE